MIDQLTILVMIIVYASIVALLVLLSRKAWMRLTRLVTYAPDGTRLWYHPWSRDAYWVAEVDGGTPAERLARHRYLLAHARLAVDIHREYERWEARRFGGRRSTAGVILRTVKTRLEAK